MYNSFLKVKTSHQHIKTNGPAVVLNQHINLSANNAFWNFKLGFYLRFAHFVHLRFVFDENLMHQAKCVFCPKQIKSV